MAREPFNEVWAETPTQFEEPPTARFDEGWVGGAAEDPPEAKWQNWWQNRVDSGLQQIERDAAMEWLSSIPYNENGIAISPLGDMYSSVVDSNAGNDPDTDDGSNWLRVSFNKATETVFGFFRKAGQTEVDNGSTDEAVVTPQKMLFGFESNLSSIGYIKFPSWMGGLIVQWGGGSFPNGGRITFPKEFPNSAFRVLVSDETSGVSGAIWPLSWYGLTSTGYNIRHDSGANVSHSFIVIGR